ncbi:hypothetical protein KBZ94_34835 [Streptomyces sp. RM72]|uniref:hypothetical protein n=1 Tax=Streptomyces sp. RM72 TaxID=1115510 RepID=UPI001B387710|nr:hypothetical protein [Streptomyces sp. RM72]MBQ0890045.1 hypothetical protein [Streptomyces sp. RM72]
MSSSNRFDQPPTSVHVAGAAPGDGWQYVAFMRARVSGHKGNSVIRRPDDGTGVVGAEIIGVAVCLLPLPRGTAVRVNASSETNEYVLRLAAGERLPLPPEIRHLRDLFTMVTGTGPSPHRLLDPRLTVVDRLENAVAGRKECLPFDHLMAEIEISMKSTKRRTERLTRLAGEPGFTADYTDRNGQGVCAFVETKDGAPVGPVMFVPLPEAIDSAWGETAAVLLAFLYARAAGQEDPVIFSDSQGTVDRLQPRKPRKSLQQVLCSSAPPVIQRLLEHPHLARLRTIRTGWVPRYSTAAQGATDQVARLVTGGVVPDGTVRLTVQQFLDESPLTTLHELQQRGAISGLEYSFSSSGPAHRLTFLCAAHATHQGQGLTATSTGSTKKAAKTKAAGALVLQVSALRDRSGQG